MPLSRRSFLLRAALAGGAAVLPSGVLLSSAGCGPNGLTRRTDHYFVFYFMMGGWDLMLHTDPVPPKEGLWVPFEDDELVHAGAHKFGPAFKPLLPYVHKMAVLRGIYCDALNHPQARFRMATGRFKPAGAGGRPGFPSVQAILADEMKKKTGKSYEIPNISSDALRPSTFRGEGMDALLEPVRVSSVDQLKALVNWRGDAGKNRREIEDALREKDAMTTKRYGDASPLPAEFEQYAELARDALDSDYAKRVKNIGTLPTDTLMADRASRNARLAIECIKNDLAPVVTVGSGEYDSHTRAQYAGHRASVLRGMKTVADICEGLDSVATLDGRTLLDKTTVVVTSEFSREPWKNELGGKHHWPANSMLLIGKGVKHKKSGPVQFNECDDGLNPEKINARNGSKTRGADTIEMSHAIATVLAIAGFDPVTLIGQEPVPDLMAT